MNAKEIRQEARQGLKGKWQKAIVISIIYAAIIFVLTLLIDKVSSIFSIVELVITPALTYGIAHSYYHLRKGDEVGYADFLTVGFQNFGKAWKIAWEIIKKTWWCILLVIIPLIVMIALIGGALFAALGSGVVTSKSYMSGYSYGGSTRSSYKYNYDYDYDDYLDSYLSNYGSSSNLDSKAASQILAGASVGAIIGAGIALIVYVALAIFLTIRLLLYVLAYYIAVIKEGIDPKEAVVESETLMKGNRGRYFCLMLSFFGWFFLVGFVTGLLQITGIDIIGEIAAEVGIAILNPYIAFAAITFYENISKERKMDVGSKSTVQINENNN